MGRSVRGSVTPTCDGASTPTLGGANTPTLGRWSARVGEVSLSEGRPSPWERADVPGVVCVSTMHGTAWGTFLLARKSGGYIPTRVPSHHTAAGGRKDSGSSNLCLSSKFGSKYVTMYFYWRPPRAPPLPFCTPSNFVGRARQRELCRSDTPAKLGRALAPHVL